MARLRLGASRGRRCALVRLAGTARVACGLSAAVVSVRRPRTTTRLAVRTSAITTRLAATTRLAIAAIARILTALTLTLTASLTLSLAATLDRLGLRVRIGLETGDHFA